MRVKVLKKHIKDGKRDNGCECPIALAIRKGGHGFVHVFVHHTMATWYLMDGDGMRSAILPLKARQFIQRFDAGKSVKPFEFTINTG